MSLPHQHLVVSLSHVWTPFLLNPSVQVILLCGTAFIWASNGWQAWQYRFKDHRRVNMLASPGLGCCYGMTASLCYPGCLPYVWKRMKYLYKIILVDLIISGKLSQMYCFTFLIVQERQILGKHAVELNYWVEGPFLHSNFLDLSVHLTLRRDLHIC